MCIRDSNRNANDGGVKLKDNYIYTNIGYPIENNRLPGHSFLIDKTGENSEHKFGAFMYGPKTTFISATPKSKWVQITNNEDSNNSSMIVTSRGSYGYIANTLGQSIEGNITNLILDSNLTLIPYGGYQNNGNELEIIGVGKKINELPAGTLLNSSVSLSLIHI